jgi:hypothetical protein
VKRKREQEEERRKVKFDNKKRKYEQCETGW